MPTPPDDVTLNKAAIIERSVRRMREEYAACPALDSFTHVDALTLNLERACQAAIDLAMHTVAHAHMGMPQSSADAFVLLGRAGRISDATVRAMVAMTGFRNVAIHEYRELDLGILRTIAQDGWKSLVVFCSEMGATIRP
ncbi:MAG: DUF86 domain-containing protein [Lentisphaerae bacterium]|nr:DUF86 domain-containing protein [Lentisphaerota bacterium]